MKMTIAMMMVMLKFRRDPNRKDVLKDILAMEKAKCSIEIRSLNSQTIKITKKRNIITSTMQSLQEEEALSLVKNNLNATVNLPKYRGKEKNSISNFWRKKMLKKIASSMNSLLKLGLWNSKETN